MEKNTFTDEQLADLINRNFIPVQINIDERNGLKAKEDYRVVLLPSMLVFDTRGVVVGRYEESMPASRLSDLLRRHYRELTGIELPEPAPRPVASTPQRPASTISRPALGNAEEEHPMVINNDPLQAGKPAAQPGRAYDAPRQQARPLATSQEGPGSTSLPPPTASSKSGFGIQIGTYSNYDNVVRQVDKLEKLLSQPVQIFISEANGNRIYRLVVGAFDTRTAAENYAQELQRQSISGFVKNLSEL